MLDVPNLDAHGRCELGLCLLEHGGAAPPAGHEVGGSTALVVRGGSLDVFGVADARGTLVAEISLPDGVLFAVLPALANVVGRECDAVLDGSGIFADLPVVFLCDLHRFLQQHTPRLHHRENGRQNGQPDRRHVFLSVVESHGKGIVVYRARR